MPPVLRVQTKGKYEAGPGIYGTTSYTRAAGYAKGGGSVIEFGIDPEIVLLEDIEIPFDELIEAAKSLRGGSKTVKDLEYCARMRVEAGRSAATLPAAYLVNQAVANGNLGGQSGIWLAEWLADRNIHASIQTQPGDEDWIVVFDPKKIVECRKVSSTNIEWSKMRLPRIKSQISKIRSLQADVLDNSRQAGMFR